MKKINKVTRNGVVYGYVYLIPRVKDCFIFLHKGMDNGPRSASIEHLAGVLKKDGFVIC